MPLLFWTLRNIHNVVATTRPKKASTQKFLLKPIVEITLVSASLCSDPPKICSRELASISVPRSARRQTGRCFKPSLNGKNNWALYQSLQYVFCWTHKSSWTQRHSKVEPVPVAQENVPETLSIAGRVKFYKLRNMLTFLFLPHYITRTHFILCCTVWNLRYNVIRIFRAALFLSYCFVAKLELLLSKTAFFFLW